MDCLELSNRCQAWSHSPVGVAHPEVRVLVVSLDGDRLHIERALQTGASGYLTKQEAPVRILSAIQEVLEGQTYVQAQTT